MQFLVITLFFLNPSFYSIAQELEHEYWSQSDSSELGVVQNRKYKNVNRFDLTLNAGTFNHDAFVKTYSFGLNVGYFFSERIRVGMEFVHYSNQASSALKTFEKQSLDTVNTNLPKSLFRPHIDFHFLYGKASLAGNLIIYVDLFLIGGLGLMSTESGRSIAPTLGLGQRIFLNQLLALELRYQLMWYQEKILEKNNPNRIAGERTNASDSISIGVVFSF